MKIQKYFTEYVDKTVECHSCFWSDEKEKNFPAFNFPVSENFPTWDENCYKLKEIWDNSLIRVEIFEAVRLKSSCL